MSDTIVVPNNDPAAIESGNSWNGLDTAGAPVIVTFSFPTSLPAYDETIGGFTPATIASFTPFTAAEQAQALAALGQWAAASGIVFIEVPPGEGDITFANVSFSTTTTGSENGDYQGAAGIGFYPFGDWSYLTGNASSGYGFTSDLGPAGAVFMNSDYLNNGTVDLGTLLHEIGHAIGMKHPDQVVYTADGVEHNQVLDPTENSALYTIMSETGDAANEGNASLFALDKLAAADLYGPAGTGGVETTSASGVLIRCQLDVGRHHRHTDPDRCFRQRDYSRHLGQRHHLRLRLRRQCAYQRHHCPVWPGRHQLPLCRLRHHRSLWRP